MPVDFSSENYSGLLNFEGVEFIRVRTLLQSIISYQRTKVFERLFIRDAYGLFRRRECSSEGS